MSGFGSLSGLHEVVHDVLANLAAHRLASARGNGCKYSGASSSVQSPSAEDRLPKSLRFAESDMEFDDAEIVFRHACKLGLEGIVSKRLGSPYRSGRSHGLAQVQEPGSSGSEAGGGRGLE